MNAGFAYETAAAIARAALAWEARRSNLLTESMHAGARS
jgi:hypothetical protein